MTGRIGRYAFWFTLYLPLVCAFAISGALEGFWLGLVEGHQSWLRGWRVVSAHPTTWMHRKAINHARARVSPTAAYNGRPCLEVHE
jgi:hypothetical protein